MNSLKAPYQAIIIATFLLPSLARAQNTSLANGRVWRAPVITSVTAAVSPAGYDLKAACDDFEAMNAKYAGLPLGYRKQMFDEERRSAPADQFPQTSFSVELRTSLPADGSLLSAAARAELSNTAKLMATGEDRVMYTQSTDAESVDVASLVVKGVQSRTGSLTEAASGLGLSTLPVRFAARAQGIVMLVTGKDLACDLVRGRASVSVSAQAYARLSQENQVTLKSFYSSVGAIADGVVSKFHRPAQRAAMLGYRLSELIATLPGMSEPKIETAMLAEIDAFFDPSTLDTNALWSVSGNQRALSVQGISDAFNVEIIFNAKEGK